MAFVESTLKSYGGEHVEKLRELFEAWLRVAGLDSPAAFAGILGGRRGSRATLCSILQGVGGCARLVRRHKQCACREQPAPACQVGRTLPHLKIALRCFAHGAQKAQENAMLAIGPAQLLIQKLVTKLSGSDSKKRGSLARTLKNSPKLLHLFQEEARKSLVSLADTVPSECLQATSKHNFSFAPQRWGTILKVLRFTVLHLEPLINFLTKVSLLKEDTANSSWARETLTIFTLPNILLLGMLTEFCQAAEGYVRTWDNYSSKGGTVGRASHCARVTAELEHRLACLFKYEQQGVAHVPLTLNEEYRSGYVQLAVRSLGIGASAKVVFQKGFVVFLFLLAVGRLCPCSVGS